MVSVLSVVVYFCDFGVCIVLDVFAFCIATVNFTFVIFFFFSSRRRHTRCALVTGVQTCALPISCGNRAMASVMTRGLFLDRAISVARVLRPDRAVLVVTTGTRPGLSSRDRFIVGDASLRDGGLESTEPGLRSP